MLRRLALGALILVGALGAVSAPALAAHAQVAMIEDLRVMSDPTATVAQYERLGVGAVRLFVLWQQIAPQPYAPHPPAHFQGSDPAAYADSAWAPYDAAVRAIQAGGMTVDLDVSGDEPLWAAGRGMPSDQLHLSWEPNAAEFGAFYHAVAERYGGDYDPLSHRIDPGDPADLPRVGFWSIWNEPNYGPSLAPQGVPSHLATDHAPEMYRQLIDAGWQALQATGHAHDTILFGELAPRGYPGTGRVVWGVFSGMKPLPFLRSLYCVDDRYRPLRGSAATVRGCPTSAAGTRGFPAAHPALFGAGGFAIHPYSRWHPPNLETPNDPDYASLADIGQLTGALDRLQRVYGSHRQFPIWNTEYGYLTDPPKHTSARIPYISPTTAAAFLNQAEYISWSNPRVRSFMQYLLYDDPAQPSAANDWGGFASGLIAWNGQPKPTYDAWRLPLWLPVSAAARGTRLEVWGCARPAAAALREALDAPESVAIRFRTTGGHGFTTIATVPITDPHGYFDVRVAFPGSGTVHLAWTYPPHDPALPAGTTVSSRSVTVTLY